MVSERRFPSLSAIRAFEAAARLGSFAKAAQELDTTAASVSYHVRRLEAQTGVRLFLRHPHRVVLTASGELVAREAIAAFAALRASFAQAAEADEAATAGEDQELVETITVTAQKRPEALEDIPMSVSVVSGEVLEPSSVNRAEPSSRTVVGDFSLSAQAVIITSGGIGGNHDLVRKNWPERMGTPPKFMLSGVPDFVDGHMMEIAQKAGASIINADRMWHYPEGIANYAPVWGKHGIRILPGPSPLWLDADGKRLPIPLFPGFDALGSLQHITTHGHEHSWFVLNKKIIGKEFALSGSEQNPDLTGKDTRAVLKRALPGAVAPVEAFAQKSKEFIQAGTVADLARGMNALTGASRSRRRPWK